MRIKQDLPISSRIKQVWAPGVPIEVRFGLAKVGLVWIEFTLYALPTALLFTFSPRSLASEPNKRHAPKPCKISPFRIG